MRIRKNARLITSSSSSSFLVCQLNRSPWDVDSFSLQDELEDDIGVNGNLASSESLPSVESMELSFEYVDKTLPPPSPQLPTLNDRNNWKPPLKEGPPLPPISTPLKKRGRPKKSTSTAVTTTTTTNNSSNNNPYEFYYYSGFGPSWGKRRGNKCTSTIIVGNESNNISNCYSAIVNDVDGSPSSFTSDVMCEDDDDNKNNINNSNDNSVVVIDRIVEGELDYIEDDFYDDDEDEHLRGRRVRKPVKARSLKSLM